MARWNKADVPHKGWKHIGIEDFGEDVYPGEEIRYEQCEMCGNEKIHYVHILTHPEFDGELRVGCDCASNLSFLLNRYNIAKGQTFDQDNKDKSFIALTMSKDFKTELYQITIMFNYPATLKLEGFDYPAVVELAYFLYEGDYRKVIADAQDI